MPEATKEVTSRKRPKRVTLQDIAKVAGVHAMTVSDALNDTRRVAPATRERVKQIAKELNYVPNSAARALVTGRTHTIAILSGTMNEPYYASMTHCIEKHLSSSGYKLLLIRTPRDVKELVSSTGNTAVDGVISIDMYDLVDEFRTHPSVPCVSIGTFNPNFVDHVIIDLTQGVEEAVQLMLDAGRQRVAYLVTAPELAEPSEVRARAYLNVIEKAGRLPEVIDVATDDFMTVRTRFKAYIEEHGCPDALLCQNDETAMCAYRVLRDSGHSIPDDVLLAGCDGQLHMEYFDPPLSTIVQPMEEVCELAWEFLQRRMAHPDLPLQQATLHGSLIIRPSLMPTALTPTALMPTAHKKQELQSP